MENNVKEYLAFKRGEIKMPEHLTVRKGVTGELFRNRFLELLTRTSIFPPIIVHVTTSAVSFWYGTAMLGIQLVDALLIFACGLLLLVFRRVLCASVFIPHRNQFEIFIEYPT